MPRTKYFYNQKSLSFEKVSENRGYVLWRLLGISSLIIVSVAILSVIISRFITDSYDDILDKKTKAAEFEIKQLQRDLRELDATLSDLREKDENIYRAIYGVAPPKIKEVADNDYQELLKLSHGNALIKLKKRLS